MAAGSLMASIISIIIIIITIIFIFFFWQFACILRLIGLHIGPYELYYILGLKLC